MSTEQSDSFLDIIYRYKDNLNIVISRLLLLLGFKSKLIGTEYLKQAIVIRYGMAANGINFSKDIYPKIGQGNGVKVERDIRTAIRNCYDSGGMYELNRISDYEIITKEYVPTNSELITFVAAWLKLMVQETEYSSNR